MVFLKALVGPTPLTGAPSLLALWEQAHSWEPVLGILPLENLHCFTVGQSAFLGKASSGPANRAVCVCFVGVDFWVPVWFFSAWFGNDEHVRKLLQSPADCTGVTHSLGNSCISTPKQESPFSTGL